MLKCPNYDEILQSSKALSVNDNQNGNGRKSDFFENLLFPQLSLKNATGVKYTFAS